MMLWRAYTLCFIVLELSQSPSYIGDLETQILLSLETADPPSRHDWGKVRSLQTALLAKERPPRSHKEVGLRRVSPRGAQSLEARLRFTQHGAGAAF